MIESYRRRKAEEARAAELARLRSEADATVAAIATSEDEVATDNHGVGECLVVGGTLCRTTRVIVRGERIVEGINVERTTLVDEIARIAEKE